MTGDTPRQPRSRPYPVTRLGLLIVLVSLVCPPGVLPAQQLGPGSRLLEVSHWAYEYLRRLRSAGYLSHLDLLRQPLTRREVRRELAKLGPDSLPEPQASWVRLLRAEFPPESDPPARPRAGALVLGGATAASSQRLDALRPTGSGGVWLRGEFGAWVESGLFAGETRVLGDTYLVHDPDGRVPTLPLGGMSDHTYASLGGDWGRVVLGRFSNNWAEAGTRGLLLSDNPLSYPQVAVQLERGRVAFQAFTAQLDTLGGTMRYLAGNRAVYVGPHASIAFTEAILYSAAGAGVSLQLLNPFSFLLFEHENPPDENRSENLMLGMQFWYGGGSWDVYGDGLLDDIDINPDPQFARRAPTRFGATLGARWRPLGPRVEANVAYQRVSSYAYRTYRLQERYEYFGRGLGENFADYDRLEFALDVFPSVRGLRLTPSFELLRQGEGDLRATFPDDSTFRAGPSLLLGVVERTHRVALRGRYQPMRALWVGWDIGTNFVQHAEHVPGSRSTKFIALGELGVRFDFGPR